MPYFTRFVHLYLFPIVELYIFQLILYSWIMRIHLVFMRKKFSKFSVCGIHKPCMRFLLVLRNKIHSFNWYNSMYCFVDKQNQFLRRKRHYGMKFLILSFLVAGCVALSRFTMMRVGKLMILVVYNSLNMHIYGLKCLEGPSWSYIIK